MNAVNELSANLRSADAAARAAAADQLAFGDLVLPAVAVGELESLLTDDRSPHDLAVLLAALGRTLAGHPELELAAVEKVRELSRHPDPRVSWQARAALTATNGSQGAREGGGSGGLLTEVVAPPLEVEVPLNDLPAPPSDVKRKAGRPVQTQRRLNGERFLAETLPALEAAFTQLQEPIVDRFNTLLSKLAGHAASTFEENWKLTMAVVSAARRYGVELLLEKDGVRHAVHVRCTKSKGREVGHFVVRTRYGSAHLTNSVTWPGLAASRSVENPQESE